MMGLIARYLITVNIIGFILYGVNMWIHTNTAKKRINVLLTVVSLAGGSIGTLVFMLLFDRKATKDNMMSKVFITCVFIVQVIVFLFIKGHHADSINFAFWTFFIQHKILTGFLAVINFIAFAAFAVDKYNAMHNRGRIRIVTLLGLAFIGGSVGGLLAMYLFRHKTNKDYFTVGIPSMMVMQMAVIFYMMNAGW